MSPRAPRDSLRRRDTHTHNKDRNGDPMRCIIICSLTTLTTVGCSTGFVSHVYRYFALGSRDSVEAAVCPYDNGSGPFSRGGDFWVHHRRCSPHQWHGYRTFLRHHVWFANVLALGDHQGPVPTYTSKTTTPGFVKVSPRV